MMKSCFPVHSQNTMIIGAAKTYRKGRKTIRYVLYFRPLLNQAPKYSDVSDAENYCVSRWDPTQPAVRIGMNLRYSDLFIISHIAVISTSGWPMQEILLICR